MYFQPLRRFASALPWSPHRLTRSVLRGWWSADDHAVPALMTDDGSGLISSWTDQIGGLAATASAAARPTWANNSFVGTDGVARAGVTFDGLATNLTSGTTSTLPIGSAASEIFIVSSFGDPAVGSGIMLGYGTSVANSGRRVGTNTSGIKVDNGTTTDMVPWTSGPHILHGWWNGLQMGGSVDGVDLPIMTLAALTTTTLHLRIGAALGGTAGTFCAGVFRRGLITTGLTAPQRQQMQGYLAWDSGLQALLPSNHPYKGIRP